MKESKKPAGFLTLTLHAHLPYVVNHGTWPHGMEWLHEAVAETYLPLLRVLGNLERDGVRAQFNLNLSPILLEQLVHPVFQGEFPKYVNRKIVAAREDEATFTGAGEAHLAEMARFWQRFYTEKLSDFEGLGGDLIGAFRRFHEAGLVDLITGAATHGYLPLLGTDESVRAQVRMAVKTHVRHIGHAPSGVWIPECGYRPAGFWAYPVGGANGGAVEGFERIGVEQALGECGLQFFFVDTHLVERTGRVASPYGGVTSEEEAGALAAGPRRSLYQAYGVDGPSREAYAVTVFPRDPRTGLQVWSGEIGYPGDGNYLDFHKKRYPGGHRYWQVTGSRVAMGEKRPYWPQQAMERVRSHAQHFAGLVKEALEGSVGAPILCAPFDAELFGHWWFEGPMWLEAVCRALHEAGEVELISCREYLETHKPGGYVAMHEGSWGAGGADKVWLNAETSWTYERLYPAEIAVRAMCTAGAWRGSELGERVLQQICRELMLLEASDWQFLMTTGAARDYAEVRFNTHLEQFEDLRRMYAGVVDGAVMNAVDEARLAAIELRDTVFPDIDPEFWVAGAHG